MKYRKLIIVALFLIIYIFLDSISLANDIPLNSEAGILIEAKTGRILYSLNCHKKLPMASTTKIMTALVALEKGNLDDIVKIDRTSVGIEGSSIYLYEGEEIALRDLLYGLMLRSGNDAAIAIAKHIGGNVERFVQMMNEKAREIGAYNTNFTNPHGLSEKNHYTTAYDLALITREAMKNNEFKKIVSTRLWIADRKSNNYFYNKNKTLWQYEGGNGVKIGYTKNAGRCLVASAIRNNMQLIAVVLNDSSWFDDCYRLFDYGFNNYNPMVIYDKEQFVKSVYVPNGKSSILPVITNQKLILPLKDDEKKKIKIHIKLPKQIKAPIQQGQELGFIEVFLDGKLVSKEGLIAKHRVEENNIFNNIVNYIKKIFN